MNNLYFYNHYHNGDVFASKAHVKTLMGLLPDVNCAYFHANSPKILSDIITDTYNIALYNGFLNERVKIFADKDTVYVNTWIGNYLQDSFGINFIAYNKMFNKIYDELRAYFDLPEKYPSWNFPEIDYSKYDVPIQFEMDDSFILFSNGPVLSGQSSIGATFDIAKALVDSFPNNKFILTHNEGFQHERVFYTSEIINTNGGDLNEISWLAQKCKVIIGRNSGPFFFAHTGTILNDPEKLFVSFGNKPEDALMYGLDLDGRYHFINDGSPELIDTLIGVIRENKV